MPGLQMNRNPDTSKNWLKLVGLKRSPSAWSGSVDTQEKSNFSLSRYLAKSDDAFLCACRS